MVKCKRVIVIEDDSDCLTLLVDALQYEGYDTIGMPTIIGAFDRIKSSQPDVVICDMLFNRQPAGLRLIDDLLRDPLTCAIPVILCSAALELMHTFGPKLRRSSLYILPKPFDLRTLSDMLARMHT